MTMDKNLSSIFGAGGGDEQHTPHEADDTLLSKAYAGIIDLIGEGEIGGLVDGARSIFLNDTPIQNPGIDGATGTYNFNNPWWEERKGTPNQTFISGSSALFDSVGVPQNVGTQLKCGISRSVTILNSDVNEVIVVVSVPQLLKQEDNGDTNGAGISYEIAVKVGNGADQVVGTFNIAGKTRSRYQKSHLIPLPDGASRQIKLTRKTEDSNSGKLSNDLYFDSYIARTTVKLAYPNTALMAISIDAEQFSSIPKRAYLVDGLYIQVPSNYNTSSRTYSGIWNGTFKVAVSSNPAWVLYDILTNDRYGLGNFLSPNQIDKAELYTIGKYCDELVSNGNGGTEPRFTINTVIASQSDAYKLVSDICSVFRGMGFWNGGVVSFTHDAPKDPSMVYNQANVIDGIFSYTGTSRKDRHSVVLITWNDPNEQYKQKIEYVEDPELVQRYGIRQTEILAFGCTSQGQAHRMGRWVLYTEQYETQLVSFSVGVDSALVIPGDVVQIYDENRGGKRMGGRILSATATSVTVDAPITLGTGNLAGSVTIAVRLDDGTFTTVPVNQLSGTVSTFTFASQAKIPAPGAIFVLSEANLKPLQARVVGIAQGETAGTFNITALENNPNKYEIVEGEYRIVPPVPPVDRLAVETPTDLKVELISYVYAVGASRNKLSLTWSGSASTYEVLWRTTSLQPWNISTVAFPTFELNDASLSATYEFQVVAINTYKIRSTPATLVYNYVAPASDTGLITGMEIDFVGLDCNMRWRPNSVLGSFEFGSEPTAGANAGADAGAMDANFKDWQIEIFDVVHNKIARIEYVTAPQYTYTYEKNCIDFASGGGTDKTIKAARKLRIDMRVRHKDNSLGEKSSFEAENKQITAMIGPGIVNDMLGINFYCTLPSDYDYDGIVVWASKANGFTPSDENIVYEGKEVNVPISNVPLDPNDTWYVRAAMYDAFDRAGMVITPQFSGKATKITTHLLPGEIVSANIAAGAIRAEQMKLRRHMIY